MSLNFEEEAMKLMENEEEFVETDTVDTDEPNVDYEMMSEDDERQEKKTTRENSRIRDLINQKKEMEEMLLASREELKKVRSEKSKDRMINNVPDEIDKHELFKKLKSENADEFIDGLENISRSAVKKMLMEELAEIKDPLSNLARNNRALQDGINPNEIEKVFSKYPNLRDQANGYDIAKELIKSTASPRAKDYSTKKTSSSRATGKKEKMTKADFRTQLADHLRNGGGF